MIEEADRDGDGEISEDEFMRIMRKTNLFWAKINNPALTKAWTTIDLEMRQKSSNHESLYNLN